MSGRGGVADGDAEEGHARICVDGMRYRWIARKLEFGLRIAVQASEQPGAVLILRTDQNIAAQHVPPSQVAAAIQSARNDGWEPQRPGSPVEVAVSF